MKRKNDYWTIEQCKKEALKYKTRTQWANGSPSSYIKSNKNKWLDECSKHMEQGRKPDNYWNFEKCLENALQYKIKSKWRTLSVGAAISSIKNGWYDECTKHMVSPIKPMGYWTKEKCIEDSKQYNSSSEWIKKSPSSYNSAIKFGIREMCSSHMIVGKKPSGYWTKKKCIESSKLFSRPCDWRAAERGAVNAANKLGIYNKCTRHMNKFLHLAKNK